MRSLDWVLSGLGLLGAVLLVLGVPRALFFAFLALFSIALVAHFVFVGPYWQSWPVYLAFAILFYAAFTAEQTPARGVAIFAVALFCTLSAALTWQLPLFTLPQPTGSISSATRTFYVTDFTRSRNLVVQVWYPASLEKDREPRAKYARPKELNPFYRYQSRINTNSYNNAEIASTGAPFPVILFSPKWGGRRTQDTFLMEELASQGYVVAAVDHPGNAARVEMADGQVIASAMKTALDLIPSRTAQQIRAAWDNELAVWTADNRFVLDELERMNAGGWAAGRLDLRHVGAVGHSFGGAASLALLGADARVKCAINMDGWTFSGLDQRREQSMMLLYEEANPAPGVEGQLDAEDQAILDTSLQQYGGYRASIQRTQHADFTDATLMSRSQRLTATGPIAGERIRNILRSLVLGFFNKELKGQGSIPTYPEVIVTTNKPPQK